MKKSRGQKLASICTLAFVYGNVGSSLYGGGIGGDIENCILFMHAFGNTPVKYRKGPIKVHANLT